MARPGCPVDASSSADSTASASSIRCRSACRRRRGRWGVLQDRFTVAATRAGAGGTEPNRDLAEVLTGEDARWLADELDRSAFSPSWQDDDAVYQRGRTVLVELEHAGRR